MNAATLLSKNLMTPLMAFLKKRTSTRGIVSIFKSDDVVTVPDLGFFSESLPFILFKFT